LVYRFEVRYYMEEYVQPKVKNVGKPYAGEPHVRFDEEGLATPVLYFTTKNDRSTTKYSRPPAIITVACCANGQH
jgi:hypothetical protein